MSTEYSISPDGEKFPLPSSDDYAPEYERLKHIVDELKNYVRDKSADLTQSVDINEVLKSTVSLLSNMIKKSTNHFSIEYGNNLPMLKGNFQRLEQVVINLVQNACQAFLLPSSLIVKPQISSLTFGMKAWEFRLRRC